MIKQKWPIIISLFSLFLPWSYISAGTIVSSYTYAWSNNLGYINFENVLVDDQTLSGYAWSANAGWIKFNPAQGGVLNDGTGNLSGSAWGAHLGWIDFNGTSINGTTGEFSGTATGEIVGTITFDCSYCDVRTDWRQTSVPSISSSSESSSRERRNNEDIVTPSLVKVKNEPLILSPQQSGKLFQDTPVGEIILEVPTKAISKKVMFTISYEPLIKKNNHLVIDNTDLINSVFYNISAQDENGDDLHFFSQPITISLPLPEGSEKNLAVYWLNEKNTQWALIPDAIFSEDKVTFTVNHLTKFAIFATKNLTTGMPVTTLPSLPLSVDRTLLQKDAVVSENYSQQEVAMTRSSSSQSLSTRDQTRSRVPILVFFFMASFIPFIIFFWKKEKKR